METEKLKGTGISITDLNLAMYGEMDPDMPRIPTAEFKKYWESAKPKLSGAPVGKIIVGSTGGDTSANEFNKLWEDGNK